VRLQIAKPTEHAALVDWPFTAPLDAWAIDGMQEVTGLHRHVVRLIEAGERSYVVKELPDVLALREWRLLRELSEAGLPTAEVVGVVTERPAAGALSAYIIDVETGERHSTLSDGQRRLDITIAIENVAGDLEDLHAAGRLAADIDPILTAQAIETTYDRLWAELTGVDEFSAGETARIGQRLQRLHELGFDVEEMELVTDEASDQGTPTLRLVPRVVEHGFHVQRLRTLVGLDTGENQARRLLNDISWYRALLEQRSGRKLPETVAATRWLDERFTPTIAAIPAHLAGKLEPAELYHQVLEHLWFLSEAAGTDVGLAAAVASYVRDVLAAAPSEHRST
jgi:hypothetical protein